MFGRFMPREGRFFELFDLHAEQAVLAARELVALFDEGEASRARIESISDIETRADKVLHDTVALLHKTFITPFDREAIHALTSNMDDIVDSIHGVADAIPLYNVGKFTPEMKQLAELSLSACERVKIAVHLIGDMKNSRDMLATCREIGQLEADCDRVMRNSISKLFRFEKDAVQIIKMKAIYESLEEISDHCEDVANIIEGIVLENA